MHKADQTITYFRLDDNGRANSGQIINGASWSEKTISTVTDKEILIAKVVNCRIPTTSLPAGFEARQEDMLVHGMCSVSDVSDVALRHNHGAVTIKAVHNNLWGCSPHWKLEAV